MDCRSLVSKTSPADRVNGDAYFVFTFSEEGVAYQPLEIYEYTWNYCNNTFAAEQHGPRESLQREVYVKVPPIYHSQCQERSLLDTQELISIELSWYTQEIRDSFGCSFEIRHFQLHFRQCSQ